MLSINLDSANELTISAGAVTVTRSFHKIAGEGAASDDLATISGGEDGDLLWIYPSSSAQDITLKHGTGNIVTGNGQDYTIPDNGVVQLQHDGSNWRVIGTGENSIIGALGSTDNAVPRADGTGGKKLQSSGVTIDDSDNVTIPGSVSAGGRGVLAFDATTGRVLRRSYAKISDGTNATTVKCQMYDLSNGDAIAAEDNLGKGGDTGSFNLSGGGGVVTIEAGGLSGNAVMVLGTLRENTTGTAVLIYTSVSSNNILIGATNAATGASVDLTSLVDSGYLLIDLLYITAG